MDPSQLPEDVALVERLPADRPCSTAEAFDLGLTHRQLARLVRLGLLRRPVKGVYVGQPVADTLAVRLEVLRLVVPANCVVTDRTAGWLWAGDRMLAPGQHLDVPALSVFCRPGHRLRSELTRSGERTFVGADLTEVAGVCVTTPLRTACDLGRVLHRDQAFAALDSLVALRVFDLDELLGEVGRFKGFRGVVQLRWMAPLTDPRSQSQFESILRLRWFDAGLPHPDLQVEVETPWGTSYWLDIGLVEELFAAEYDGEEFHDVTREKYDERRRAWMRVERDWQIVVVRKEGVTGPRQDATIRLTAAWLGRRSGPKAR